MNTKKKIEDYLHLYLGCESFFDRKVWKINKIGAGLVRLIRRDDKYGKWVECHYDECKPILRPLSDMTEEEAKYIVDNTTLKQATMGHSERDVAISLAGRWQANSHIIVYLLSKHFDLFGLIESGLCLYKEDLK